MIKFIYVAQDAKGVYQMGVGYGRPGAEEQEIIDTVQDYCKGKNYRLVLIVQVFPNIPIINQVYPFECTEETRYCLNQVVNAM